jgi:hypothetical protein
MLVRIIEHGRIGYYLPDEWAEITITSALGTRIVP